MEMICKSCRSDLGMTAKAYPTYSISWRLVGKVCTKIPLCAKCDDKFKRCSPTNKEMRKFFADAEKRNKK